MKNCKLYIILLTLSFSGMIVAQKKRVIKVTHKEKGQNTEIRKENLPHFIQFGIMSKGHEGFKKKYHTDIVYQNCVISSEISSQAKKNNLALAKSLTEKYGNVWKKDLGFIPYGL